MLYSLNETDNIIKRSRKQLKSLGIDAEFVEKS